YLSPTLFTNPLQQCGVIILTLIAATAICCIPLRWLKEILFGLGALYLFVYLLLGGAALWWLANGHQAAVALNAPSQWQLNGANFPVYGLVVLALLGIDVPLFMGGEIRGGKVGTRKASSCVWWGAVLVFGAYVIGTF